MMPARMPWEEQIPPEQMAAAIITPEKYDPTEWAGVRVAPDKDAGLQAILAEGNRLLDLAQSRMVTCNADREPAAADIVVITRALKQIEAKRGEFTKPLNAFLTQINAYFKSAAAPFEQADALNRAKVRGFDNEVERRRQEAARIEAEKLALARREAELNQGEITVDLAPVPAPAPAPSRVFTTAGGSMNTRKEPKWELVDLARVPAEYLMLDTVKVGRVVRAGVREIPGIRIWEESNLAVRT